MQLTYKELQGKLKAFKEQGYQLNVKLNAKAEVLQKEWERIIANLEAQAQDALTPKLDGQAILATAAEEVEAHQESNSFLPAMTAPAPTWLKQQHQVFYIDNGCGYEQDYLLWEVDLWLQQHQGEACELPAVATIAQTQCTHFSETQQNMVAIEDLSAQALEAQPLVASPKEQGLTPSITALLGLLVAVLLFLGLSTCSKLWLRLKALALATGEPTCTQAAKNAEWLLGCAFAFISGFLKL